MPKQLKDKIHAILEDFALTFANLEDDKTYWGHDTNLGKCEEEFAIATNDLIDLFNKLK